MFIRTVKNEVIRGSPDEPWWVFSRAQNTFEKCCRFEITVERLCNVSGLKEWNACRLTIYAEKKGEISFFKSRFYRTSGIWCLTKYVLYAEYWAIYSCFVMNFWICWCELPFVLCFEITYPYHKNPKSNANGPSYLRNERKETVLESTVAIGYPCLLEL